MAQRRPITSHPAFAPLLALWFAALLGLGVAVLPAAVLGRAIESAGLSALVPSTMGGRLAASAAAALAGALLGWALALPLVRRGMHDPRPVYDEQEPPVTEPLPAEAPRRPLLARDDLPDDITEELAERDGWALAGAGKDPSSSAPPRESIAASAAEHELMIIGPPPSYPPRAQSETDANLAGLLEQFDNAITAFRADPEDNSTDPLEDPRLESEPKTDPVHAFVARQTGTPAPSPLGGRIPDHQAGLRAALGKLARNQRGD